jgi:hypothetical protein
MSLRISAKTRAVKVVETLSSAAPALPAAKVSRA